MTGKTRRLSRTFRDTKPEATAELQRFVAESGAGLEGGSTVTVAVLLESFMSTATLSPTVTPPNIDEVRLLLALAEETDPTLSCWLDIATATGVRRGEICALRWSDIERATVRIERRGRSARMTSC